MKMIVKIFEKFFYSVRRHIKETVRSDFKNERLESISQTYTYGEDLVRSSDTTPPAPKGILL